MPTRQLALARDGRLPATEEDTTPVEPDRSGWSLHPSERRDFYHRTRFFPPDVARWRKQFAQHVLKNLDRFPAASDPESLQESIDEGISYLREVARILAVLHGTPNLGNKKDPTDELVYIILARKTREGAYQKTFALLKQRFVNWDGLLDAPRRTVEKLVYSGGLSGKKTVSLFGALSKLKERFGRCTLKPAKNWSDDELETFLCSLPEIQRKSAYCIMMYSFGRQVFPVDTHVGRVLTRLGPYRELGLSLQGLDHKKLQVVLADIVPPNLRYSLHVNLIEHGRAICRSVNPLCDRCDLKGFCATYRCNQAARVQSLDWPTAADFFAGAGGISEGFERAGYKIVLALDQDTVAMKTYRLNHPAVPDNRVIAQDIRELKPGHLKRLIGRRRLDVLIGAPPCQGYSTAGFRSKKTVTGYRFEKDERNFLFEDVVDAALELQPRLFLMENVPGMQSAKKGNTSYLEAAARLLEKRGGFQTAIWKLNAAAFGVPQDRLRYFLVASSTGILPSRPEAEYHEAHRLDFDPTTLPCVTVTEAIFDLPPREAGGGTAIGRRDLPDLAADLRYRRYLFRKHPSDLDDLSSRILRLSPVIFNHTVRYHNSGDLKRYAKLRPGEDYIHLLERHPELRNYRADTFDDKYARLRGDRPSKTIVSHLAKDGNGYIHPTQLRSISFREAARLQSFHDGYVFCGSPSDQWVQLGNAVPPILARAIARSFLTALHRS